MQKQQTSSRWPTITLLAAGIIALLTLVACGNDDSDTPAAAPTATPPTLGSVPAAAAAPTATRVPVAPMVPAVAPEPGSDEEQIMAVLEKQVRAVNTADYEAFQETCTPTSGDPPTIELLKRTYEENEGAIGYTRVQVRFSPQGYNVRNVEVEMLRAPFAQARFEIWDYGELASLGTSLKTYEKVDGQWYSETLPCGSGFVVK